MIKKMGTESFYTQTEAHMKAIGNKAKWKDWENSFLKQEKSLTKEAFAKISSMDSEKSTMKIQRPYKMALIIQTLASFKNSGSTTKECSWKTKKKEKAR